VAQRLGPIIVSFAVRFGEPVAQIVEEAEAARATIIAMATHRRPRDVPARSTTGPRRSRDSPGAQRPLVTSAQMMRARPTCTNAATACSICAGSCAALICTRCHLRRRAFSRPCS